MEFKKVIQEFKSKQGTGPLRLSLLPLLMGELVRHGLDVSKATGELYLAIAAEIFENESQEFQIYVVDALALLGGMIPTPKPVEQPKPAKAAPAAIVGHDIVKTEHLVNDIPNEDDEGDPFYMPPEDRMDLRPEDFAPKQYDEAFCALLGIDTKRLEK